jgi:signal transduction histidine kinase
MVAAADDERRRIERELHDGVQQHLVALAVNVQLAEQLADTDLAAAKALLEQIGRDVRDALDGVRELANEIYPPLLLDRGLAEALRAMSSAARVPTHVEVGSLERHAPSVEATVYFCCLEALRNATASATVRAWEEKGALRFEVLDDAPASGGDGRGLATAADRVKALGGALTVSVEPGTGRRVSGTIPVAP